MAISTAVSKTNVVDIIKGEVLKDFVTLFVAISISYVVLTLTNRDFSTIYVKIVKTDSGAIDVVVED